MIRDRDAMMLRNFGLQNDVTTFLVNAAIAVMLAKQLHDASSSSRTR